MSTRAAAAYSLGLIREVEFNEIEILRRVRNRFAHGVHVSFSTDGIKDLCRNLSMCVPEVAEDAPGVRALYVTSATALILKLTNRPSYVARKRLKSEAWPY
jgi:DNA-binding MltR family transcriptional regulator